MLTTGVKRRFQGTGYREQQSRFGCCRLSPVPRHLFPVTYGHALRSASRLNAHRQAFTLIEILVVIAIIGILAALVTGAARVMMGVQQETNTNSTISTLNSILSRQWSAVVATASKESPPANVLNMAGGHPGRAQVIWIKLRLKQEFPMNLTEAASPWLPLGPYLQPPSPGVPGDLPAKPSYTSALQEAASIPGATFVANSDPSTCKWTLESAFTLVMALKQNRGGIVFKEENFPPAALATEIHTYSGSPPQPTLAYRGPKMLVDAWGGPIFFYRWPTGNPDFGTAAGASNGQAATANSPVSSNLRTAANADPLDPQGLLLDQNWNSASNYNSQLGVYWFEQYCHPVHIGNWTPMAWYTEPVIMSAGPDYAVGFTPATGLGKAFSPYNLQSASPSLPDVMTQASANPVDPNYNSKCKPSDAYDNIMSYKLRLGGAGNK